MNNDTKRNICEALGMFMFLIAGGACKGQDWGGMLLFVGLGAAAMHSAHKVTDGR